MAYRDKKGNDKLPENNRERWLLTYSDLITLLMIFFVVMYSLSNINVAKFSQLANSIGISMGTRYFIGNGTGSILDRINPNGISNKNGSKGIQGNGNQNTGNNLEDKLNTYIKKNNLGSYITLYSDERGVIISLREPLLFKLGSADIMPSHRKVLDSLAQTLKTITNYIRVEGYTDNIPIKNNKYRSNWELSVIRATNVINILVEDGINPNRLIAVGYGEYKPVVPNNSDANRQKNRRVDIVIMNSGYNKWEPYSVNNNKVK